VSRSRAALAPRVLLRGMRKHLVMRWFPSTGRVGVTAAHQRSGSVDFDGRVLRLTAAGLLMADRVGSDYLAAGLA